MSAQTECCKNCKFWDSSEPVLLAITKQNEWTDSVAARERKRRVRDAPYGSFTSRLQKIADPDWREQWVERYRSRIEEEKNAPLPEIVGEREFAYEGVSVKTRGICEALGTERTLLEGEEALIEVEDGDNFYAEARFFTSPDFGCKKFKAKES